MGTEQQHCSVVKYKGEQRVETCLVLHTARSRSTASACYTVSAQHYFDCMVITSRAIDPWSYPCGETQHQAEIIIVFLLHAPSARPHAILNKRWCIVPLITHQKGCWVGGIVADDDQQMINDNDMHTSCALPMQYILQYMRGSVC